MVIGFVSIFFIGLLVSDCVYFVYFMVIGVGRLMLLMIIGGFMQWEL